MKKSLSRLKISLLFFINTIPFALDVIFYSNGAMDNFYLFLPVFALLTILNYYYFDKVAHYIIVQIYLLACLILSGCISTHLYYNNISHDAMTPAVGMLLVYAGSIVVVITTVISAIVKKRSKTAK